jgi:hypothetical protein
VVDQTLTLLAQPPQAHTKPTRDAHLSNKERQGNAGPTYPRHLGDPIRDTCHFITTDTDPHTDIEGTGQDTLQHRTVHRRAAPGSSKKKHDYTADMVTVHDPTGRTVGMLCPERAHLLHHNYQQTLLRRPQVATSLQAKPFPEELAHLLQRYRQGTRIPGNKRKVNLQNHWATPPSIYQTIQEHLPGLTQERFASPLNYHPAMTRSLELLRTRSAIRGLP